jgi:FkbM family methyltransferase
MKPNARPLTVIEFSDPVLAPLQYQTRRAAEKMLEPLDYRGMGKFRLLSDRIFGVKRSMTVRLQDHSRMRIPFSDVSWSRPVFQACGYEPEIEFFLINFLTNDMAFIDCGANIGYWSIQVSEVIPDKRRVIAIEASPAIYERLIDNAALNDFCFTTLNRVIAATSDQVVPFLTLTDGHVGSRRLDLDHADAGHATGNAGEIDMVQSICLDDLCRDHFPDDFAGPIVVKLDVEGGEKDAVLGSHRIRVKHPVLFLYEDHGNDPSCENSDFLMSQLGWDIFWLDGNVMRKASTLKQIAEVKRDPLIGYNFAAAAPESDWSRRLRSLLR